MKLNKVVTPPPPPPPPETTYTLSGLTYQQLMAIEIGLVEAKERFAESPVWPYEATYRELAKLTNRLSA